MSANQAFGAMSPYHTSTEALSSATLESVPRHLSCIPHCHINKPPNPSFTHTLTWFSPFKLNQVEAN